MPYSILNGRGVGPFPPVNGKVSKLAPVPATFLPPFIVEGNGTARMLRVPAQPAVFLRPPAGAIGLVKGK